MTSVPNAPLTPSTSADGSGLSRRAMIGRIGVGAGVVWMAPTIVSTPAFGQTGTCLPELVDWADHIASLDNLDNPPNSFDIGLGMNSLLTVAWDDSAMGAGTATATYAQTTPLGGRGGGFIELSLDATAAGEFCELTFTFSSAVENLSFWLIDIDRGQGFWTDQVSLLALNGATPVVLGPGDYTINDPTLTTETVVGNENQFVAVVDPSGTGQGVDNTTTDGDILITYPSAVSSLTIRYEPGSTTELETQQIGIDGLSFCLYDI